MQQNFYSYQAVSNTQLKLNIIRLRKSHGRLNGIAIYLSKNVKGQIKVYGSLTPGTSNGDNSKAFYATYNFTMFMN
jgi:hypothetical protein